MRTALYVFLAVTLLLPALGTAVESFESPGAWSGFFSTDGPDLRALVFTIGISIASVVLAASIGVPLAFALHRRGGLVERALFLAALLPLALPPLIGAISVYYVYGETGILSRGLSALFGRSDPTFSPGPLTMVLIVHAVTMYPIYLLFASAALARRDPAREEAARGLGASRLRTFLTVTLPGIRPALRGATLLVFLSSLASFSAPLLFAPDQSILSVRIFTARNAGELSRSLAQTTVLTVAALVAVLLLRPRRDETERKAGRRATGRASRAALLGAAPVVLLAVLPVLAMILVAFSENGSWQTTWLPTRYTAANFAHVFAGRGMAGEAVASSLWMAAAATGVLLVLGVAAGRALRDGKRIPEALVMLPWALPGTVVAMNLITASQRVGAANAVWLLPLAYALRGLPLMARSAEAALARVPPDLEEASRGLGATTSRTFRKVVLPLAGPGIVAGAVLVFAFALGEYTASALLFRPQQMPISIAIAQEFRIGNNGSAAAVGTLLVALVAGVLLVSGKLATVTSDGSASRRRSRSAGGPPPSPKATAPRPARTPPSA